MEPPTTLFDDCCEQLHLWDLHETVQEVYSRLTGHLTDWSRDPAEPWWSLSGAFRAL